MALFLLPTFFVLAAAADALSVRWQEARERREVARLALLSMVLEALTWLPVWFAITAEDWRIAAVSIAGSGLGAAWGMRRSTQTLPNARDISSKTHPRREGSAP